MNLFIKGFIIGIGKVIPGVSGAMLAVSFGIYDKIINSITTFFDNKRENLKFLLPLGCGLFLSIVLFSNIIKYMINNYYFEVMLLFTGLIIGGVYNYSKNITFNLKNNLIIILTIIFILTITLNNINSNEYILKGNITDIIIFFIAGFIEIFSSIIPGISGTALFMIFGLYNSVLTLMSNILNISYVLNHLLIYISYTISMIISFIIISILISYILKKYRKLFDIIIFSLSISSILILFYMIFNTSFTIISLIIGIMLFFIGIILSYLLP